MQEAFALTEGTNCNLSAEDIVVKRVLVTAEKMWSRMLEDAQNYEGATIVVAPLV